MNYRNPITDAMAHEAGQPCLEGSPGRALWCQKLARIIERDVPLDVRLAMWAGLVEANTSAQIDFAQYIYFVRRGIPFPGATYAEQAPVGVSFTGNGSDAAFPVKDPEPRLARAPGARR
jgi:hypothetical protein